MNYKRLFSKGFLLIAAGVIASTSLFYTVQAALPNPATAKVTFTFDDARVSSYTNAAPTLAKYGLKGTNYVTTGCVGMTTTPNTCHAANDVKYMTWAQVKALQNTYGWEIGSHSVTHPYLASYNADDDQPTALTDAQVVSEVTQSKSALLAQGIDAKSFASPYGDYDAFSLQTIAKHYSSHRAFAEQNNNVYPYNDQLLNNMQVQMPVTLSAVKAKIDYAIANNTWLVLTFHDIVPTPSKNVYKYQWSKSNLDAVAAYVKAKQDAGQIKNVNVTEGVVTSNENLLPGGGFDNGITGGWSTDNSAAFSANAANNGSFPGATKAIQIASTTTAGHLYSPRVQVNSNSLYVLKNYLNVTAVGGGEVGFYIDEYDANGAWVSGQYKGRENSVYIENMNFTYVPSSVKVKSASLQIYTTASSGIKGFLDKSEWYLISTDSQAQTNLMPNSSFDTGLGGWRTDNAQQVTHNPSGFVAINKTGTSTESHLFSPSITVETGKSYYVENYVAISANTLSEIGFYIDEYDINGNWISGQYMASTSQLGARNVAFSYSPSSTQVKQSSLQIIFSGGTELRATIDNSKWLPL